MFFEQSHSIQNTKERSDEKLGPQDCVNRRQDIFGTRSNSLRERSDQFCQDSGVGPPKESNLEVQRLLTTTFSGMPFKDQKQLYNLRDGCIE